MIALLVLGLFIALGIAAILGWTTDSRDDAQKLWPLERTRPDVPTPAAVRDAGPHTRWDAASLPGYETIAKQRIAR